VLLALPLDGGVTEEGLKLQLDPEGRLAQERLTALEKPPVEVTVHVELVLLPWVTVRLDGLQEMLKSGVGVSAVGTTWTQLLARP
jgi:hypothetical protein